MSSNIDDAAALLSGADVWADQPSHPPSSAAKDRDQAAIITGQFDDLDPFKPDEPTNGPATPVKQAPPPPNKQLNASPITASHDLSDSPIKSKRPAAAPMTPSTSSGLANPLASIASVFRARPIASRPQTPTGRASPAVLIRDKDVASDIDDSEKSAPQAIPSYHQESLQDDSDEGDAPPFDFNLFLEQMRSRAADPIAKYLRSFLKEFNKRSWNVTDQIRVINDFLDVCIEALP